MRFTDLVLRIRSGLGHRRFPIVAALAAVAFRLPILFLGLFTPLESSAALLGPPGTAERLLVIGIGAMVLVGGLLWPLLRRDALARFLALGTVLSLVPSCATYPHNRMLMWSGLGAMGLIARFLSALLARDAVLVPRSRGYRLATAPLALALVIMHLLLAPVQKPVLVAGSNALRNQIYIPPLDEPMLPRESVVVVNGPLAFFATHFSVMQAADGLPVPGHTRILAPSFAAVELERLDSRTLVIRPAGGYFLHPFDTLYCSRSRALPVGHQVQLSDVTIEVTALTTDGRPAAIACRFGVPLEDSSLRWIYWEQGRYRDWAPPPIPGKVRLPPAVPVM